jgi:hypothetical protein
MKRPDTRRRFFGKARNLFAFGAAASLPTTAASNRTSTEVGVGLLRQARSNQNHQRGYLHVSNGVHPATKTPLSLESGCFSPAKT